MNLNRFFQNRHNVLILISVLFIYSCSSTRKLEQKQVNEVYASLHLTKGHNDNFLLLKEAASWLNTPYRENGTTRNGVDCSYLVGSIYQQVYDVKLERNSSDIFEKNCRKISKKQLNQGDLVFFNTSGNLRKKINHIGLYLKDDKFIHATTSRGVIVSDLNEEYYQKAWVCCGRVKQNFSH